MPNEEKINHLEEAEKKLYRRDVVPESRPRTRLRLVEREINKDWSDGSSSLNRNQSMNSSILAKILIFAIILFIGTLGVAAFVVWQGGNQISGKNIDFEIKGPVAVKAGDETSLQILISNRNTIELQSVKLLLAFPTDTKSASSTEIDLVRLSEPLGIIDSGEVVNKTVKATFFGQEGEEKQVKAKIEYKVPGSNALYTKDTDIFFSISSPPVGLVLKTVPEAASGQEVEVEVNISPRSRQSVDKALLVVDYPAGFTFSESSVTPSFNNNVWVLPDLSANAEQVITIKGILTGVENENKAFVATVGTQDSLGEDTISFPYNRTTETIHLREAFIGLSILADDSTKQPYIALGDRSVKFQLGWQNNLDVAVSDAVIELTFTSNIANLPETDPGKGLYRADQNKITWTKSVESALASIKPGEKGLVTFALTTKALNILETQAVRNPVINISAKLTANRNSPGFSGEKIVSETKSEVRVKTMATLSQVLNRAGGTFSNTGPIPPRVEQETTYTVTWSVTNTSSQLRDAIVKTVLPSYIEWKNIKQPTAEELVFNPTSRELVWKLGRVQPGVIPRSVAFQIGLLPTLDQVGINPVLIDEMKLSAFDTFAETMVEDKVVAVSTKQISDPGYQLDLGVVDR